MNLHPLQQFALNLRETSHKLDPAVHTTTEGELLRAIAYCLEQAINRPACVTTEELLKDGPVFVGTELDLKPGNIHRASEAERDDLIVSQGITINALRSSNNMLVRQLKEETARSVKAQHDLQHSLDERSRVTRRLRGECKDLEVQLQKEMEKSAAAERGQAELQEQLLDLQGDLMSIRTRVRQAGMMLDKTALKRNGPAKGHYEYNHGVVLKVHALLNGGPSRDENVLDAEELKTGMLEKHLETDELRERVSKAIDMSGSDGKGFEVDTNKFKVFAHSERRVAKMDRREGLLPSREGLQRRYATRRECDRDDEVAKTGLDYVRNKLRCDLVDVDYNVPLSVMAELEPEKVLEAIDWLLRANRPTDDCPSSPDWLQPYEAHGGAA